MHHATEQFELEERIIGLKGYKEEKQAQRQLEEVRELQKEDISRLQRVTSVLGIGVASLITSIVVGARTAATGRVRAAKSFARAANDAVKSYIAPWAVPPAAFVY